MTILIVFIFGLMVGSFLNVVILRMDELETIVNTRSHCPKCKKDLSWYDLVPLLSFLLLRTRCRYCKEKISLQYPLVELGTALGFAAVYQFVVNQGIGFEWQVISLIFYLLIVSFLVVLFVYDLRKYLVPDEIVWPAIILTVIFQVLAIQFIPDYRLNWMDLLLGGLIGAGVPALLSIPSKGKWMGYGDIAIGALLGLVLGYPLAIVGLFMAFCAGGLVGVVLILAGYKKLTSAVPFGPFLTAGTFAALLYGERILNWYLGFFGLRY
ncbi:MAG: prepilin peptidase [bacterium]|nr:prepilin peptidase [bacterium]